MTFRAPIAAERYTYDPLGNRTSRTVRDVTLDYDVLNRLTQASRTNQLPQTYAYDDHPTGPR